MPGNYDAFKRIVKTVDAATKVHVNVGVLDDPEQARKARYAEYGTRTAPARPFMSLTVRGRQAEILRYKARLARMLIKGTITPRGYGDMLGKYVARLMRETITKYGPMLFQPLAPSTVRRKGHAHPLIETRQMLRAIKHKVRVRGRAR